MWRAGVYRHARGDPVIRPWVRSRVDGADEGCSQRHEEEVVQRLREDVRYHTLGFDMRGGEHLARDEVAQVLGVAQYVLGTSLVCCAVRRIIRRVIRRIIRR